MPSILWLQQPRFAFQRSWVTDNLVNVDDSLLSYCSTTNVCFGYLKIKKSKHCHIGHLIVNYVHMGQFGKRRYINERLGTSPEILAIVIIIRVPEAQCTGPVPHWWLAGNGWPGTPSLPSPSQPRPLVKLSEELPVEGTICILQLYYIGGFTCTCFHMQSWLFLKFAER